MSPTTTTTAPWPLPPALDPRFWVWAAWNDAKHRAASAGLNERSTGWPKRPATLPARIPARILAAWVVRYRIHRAGLHPKPPPIIPPAIVPHVGRATLVQRLVYAAENPLAAIGLPPGSGVALTADPHPSYAAWATPATVAALRDARIWVTSWGNQEQIGADRIRALHAALGLDGEPIMQFETAAEADSMIAAGATLGVGNGNALRPDQIDHLNELIDEGRFASSQESYRNVTGGPWPKDTSAGGLKVASITVGLYNGAPENPGVGSYISLEESRDHSTPEQWRDIAAYHAAGNRGTWDAFPRTP